MPAWLSAARDRFRSTASSRSRGVNTTPSSNETASNLEIPGGVATEKKQERTALSASNTIAASHVSAALPPSADGGLEVSSGEASVSRIAPGLVVVEKETQRHDQSVIRPENHGEPLRHTKIGSLNIQHAANGTPLARAQDELHRAVEDLEQVTGLNGRLSNKSTVILKQLESASAEPREVSLNDLAEAIQQHQHAKEQELGARIGQFLRNLYPVAKLALGVMGTVADYATCPPAKIVATGVGQVFDLAMKPAAQTDLVKSGLATLCKDQSFLRNLQDIPSAAAPEDVLLCAIELQTALVSFLQVSIMWLDKNAMVKFGKSMIDNTGVQPAVERLANARDTLRNSILGESYFLLQRQEIRSQQAELLKNICAKAFHEAQINRHEDIRNDRGKSGITSWVVVEDYIDVEMVNNSIVGRASGYNKSTFPPVGLVTSPYRNFRDGRTKALWCSGLPGAGKSYIASSIVDDLDRYSRYRDAGLAYVFCQFQNYEASQQSLSTVLGAIIRQLLARKPSLCFETRHRDRLQQTNLPDRLRQQLIDDLCLEFSEVLVVVDALDEFSPDPDSRFQLVQTLRAIAAERSNFRFCMTSRLSDDAWAQLVSRDLPDAWSDLEVLPVESISVEARSEEITAWIQAYTNDPSHLHARRLLSRDSALLSDITVRITERSRGIFKLATLQLKACLDQGSAREVRKRLSNLSSEIDDYYKDTLDRALHRDRAEGTRKYVKRLLTWLLYTRGNLSYGMLQFAIGVENGVLETNDIADVAVLDLQYYIDLCEGLVVRKPSHGNPLLDRVSFSHETARTFVQTHMDISDEEGMELVLCSYLEIISHPLLLDGTVERYDFPDDFFDYDKFPSVLKVLSGSETGEGIELNDPDVPWHAAYWFWHNALQWPMWIDWLRLDQVAYANRVKKYLARFDIDIWLWWSAYYVNHLPEALGNSWFKLFKWLLEEKVDPNSYRGLMNHDEIKLPLLTRLFHLAPSSRTATCLSILVEMPKTDVNAAAEIKFMRTAALTPLFFAVQNTNPHAVSLLLSRSDLHIAKDNGSISILHHAVEAACSSDEENGLAVLEALLERQDILDINVKAIKWDCAAGREVDWRLTDESGVFQIDSGGITALTLASAWGKDSTIQRLLKELDIK